MKDNKQGRDFDKQLHDAEMEVARQASRMMRYVGEKQFEVYRTLLSGGTPRELARSVLPLSTYSHMFAKVDLHNLLGFLSLRCHSHAQFEIRVYAEAMRELAKTVAPIAVAAWEAAVMAAKEPDQ